jgi:hypothetical protein
MSKRPDFQFVRKWIIPLSLTAIVGYLVKIIDTQQDFFIMWGISIPHPLVYIISFTILFLITLSIVEFIWVRLENLPYWIKNPGKKNLHLFSGKFHGDIFTLKFISTEWRYFLKKNEVYINFPFSYYGYYLTWRDGNIASPIPIQKFKFYEVDFLRVVGDKIQIITKGQNQLLWGPGKYTFTLQVMSHVFIATERRATDRVLYAIINYMGGKQVDIKITDKKPKVIEIENW